MITLPETSILTKDQLLLAFAGGQPEQLALRNLVETLFDRENVFNIMEYGADPTGSAATFNLALERAWTAALASSVNETKIVIPPGLYKMSAAARLTQTDANKHITVEGAGSHSTTVSSAIGQENMFEIGARGNTSGTKTVNAAFKGFRAKPGASNTGSVFNLRNAKDIEFEDILFDGGNHGFSMGLGEVGDVMTSNDTIFIRVKDCAGSLGNALAGTMFRLGSGAVLQLSGERHRYNSSGGNKFMTQTDDDNTWDGAYVSGVFAEDFDSYLHIAGQGMGNIVWIGGQMDGGTGCVILQPGVDSTIRGAIFSNISVRNITGNFMLIDGSAAGARVAGIVVANNDFYNVSGHIIDCVEGTGAAYGNIIRNGGNSGTSLFEIAADGYLDVRGNIARNDPQLAPPNAYTYGINSAISLLPKGDPNNTWLNVGTAPVNGTGFFGYPATLAVSGVKSEVNNEASTAEKVLATITIPAGSMGLNGFIKVSGLFSFTNGTNDKIYRVRLGGLAGNVFLARTQATSGKQSEVFELIIQNRNSASVQVRTQNIDGVYFGESTIAVDTTAIGTGQAQDLVITGQLEVASERCTLERYHVEVLYAP